jgi:hypothetical protein
MTTDELPAVEIDGRTAWLVVEWEHNGKPVRAPAELKEISALVAALPDEQLATLCSELPGTAFQRLTVLHGRALASDLAGMKERCAKLVESQAPETWQSEGYWRGWCAAQSVFAERIRALPDAERKP